MMKVNLYQLYRIRCVGRVDMNVKIRTDLKGSELQKKGDV